MNAMNLTLLQSYIAQQPALWRKLLQTQASFTADFALRFGSTSFDRVILIGSGSSHYASLMARPVLEHVWKTEVTCLVPSEAEVPLNARQPLYIAISQSGVSTNTYTLVRRLTKAGHLVVAITEYPDSPVGQAASVTVPLLIGEESIGAKTKGVTATVLTLMLLALSVCKDESYRTELYAAMDRLCQGAEENLKRAEAWSLRQQDTLLSYHHLYVLGCGNNLGAAQEGALKLLETNYLPVSSYSLDEYLHGIQNALDSSACLLCLLPSDGPDRQRMLRLAEFSRSVGARCFLIAPGGAEDPDSLSLLSVAQEALEPLVFLPALQTVAAHLSAVRGIDTSVRRYPTFYSIMGSKLEDSPCQAGH